MSGTDVAAYIWPSYHYEPRLEHFWPERDGEWYTVRRATPRFPGHDMPRVPLLGYQDEASQDVMRQHCALASEHGINTFIMDWYWYEGQPCLERQLNDGLIPAIAGSDFRFFLMWANHDATTLWDMHTDQDQPLWSGQVGRPDLEGMFERIIDKYFRLPNYYKLKGCPVFSIFDVSNFIQGLGGLDAASDAIVWMRSRTAEKGFQGLHVQGIANLAWEANDQDPPAPPFQNMQSIRLLDLDSGSSYQWRMDAPGEGDYVAWGERALKRVTLFEKAYRQYWPHVSIGWDDTHRHPSIDKAVTGSTPFAFEAFLWKAKAYLDAHPDIPRIVTINSWNEWTEGSYLLPDMRWGYEYLRAAKRVFGAVN